MSSTWIALSVYVLQLQRTAQPAQHDSVAAESKTVWGGNTSAEQKKVFMVNFIIVPAVIKSWRKILLELFLYNSK